jgi:adenine deaminase
LVRMAIGEGLPPMTAIQMATINPAAYFGLPDVGAVAPGFKADFAVLDDLNQASVSMVVKAGRVVAQDGKALPFVAGEPGGIIRSTVNIDYKSLKRLGIKAKGSKMKAIGIIPDQIVTEKLILQPKVEEGMAVADVQRDLLKIAVVERHMASGNIGLGFVEGVGLSRGAIATSVAHDSHNILVIGANDADMRRAVLRIERMNGGICVVNEEEVLADLPLPVAGLMSTRPVAEVAAAAEKVVTAAKALGCTLPDPFITMSFLALPVIPSLKLTDRGLVDVELFQLVGLFE